MRLASGVPKVVWRRPNVSLIVAINLNGGHLQRTIMAKIEFPKPLKILLEGSDLSYLFRAFDSPNIMFFWNPHSSGAENEIGTAIGGKVNNFSLWVRFEDRFVALKSISTRGSVSDIE